MTGLRAAWIGFGALLAAVGCSNDVGTQNPFGGVDTGDTTGSASGVTSDTGSTSDAATTAASSGDDGVIYDVGAVGDIGGGGTSGSCEDAADELTNQGCRFWAVDLPNSRAPAPGGIAEDHQYAVVVANNSPTLDANVRVYVGGEAVELEAATVGPEQTHTFALPAASIDPTQTTDDGIAYRVESDVPITAYQFNPLQNTQVYSNDATVLWPEHVLTADYTAITEDATSAAGTYVSIVATADDTHVEVFPTTDLVGAATTATLARGDVFTIVSQLASANPSNGGNLSGSRVVADGPVAVFSGNVSAPVIPAGSGWVGGSRVCCADHMEHQMIPLQAWGTAYAVATPPPAYYPVDPARYRLTGAFDGTQLSWDPAPPPGAPTSIDAGQTLAFETDLSFSVTSGDPSKPFALAQFLPSGDTTDSIFDPQRRGDPAMVLLPPTEQFEDKYVFAVPSAYAINRIGVVAPGGTTIELDGTPVAAAAFSAVGMLDGVDYVYAHVDVSEGTHVVTGSGPFGITVTGYDVEVSYGFAGGSGFEAISLPPPPPG